MSYQSHAMMEFRAAGWLKPDGTYTDDMQQLMCTQVLELLAKFDDHGHSGNSAPYAINLFSKLAKFEPIVPLTGEDWEWNEVGGGTLQNKRCSHVFKQPDRFDGQAYDIYAIVFWDWYTDEDGERHKSHFTSKGSAQPITFPYTPSTVYQEAKQ